MAAFWLPAVLCLLSILPLHRAQSCSKSVSVGAQTKSFATCIDLPTQSGKLAWSFDPQNSTLAVAFTGVATSSSGWVGWGINPGPRAAMIGSSVLIAFQAPNGSSMMLDYKLTAETQGGQLPSSGPIDFVVLDRAVEIQGRDMKMFATIRLKPDQTKVNYVWNRGPGVTDFKPQQHSLATNDLRGTGQLDVVSGAASTGGGLPHQKLKNTHGFMNALGWGVLLPLGAMSARYLRPYFNPLWFYLHVSFQTAGYFLGVIGWAIGLRLGSYSKGVVRHSHRNIGITLFVLGTLQVLGGLLRPGLEHKVRGYWNVGHHTAGYLVLLLSFVNIFKGLDILEPKKEWRNAYIGILVLLVVVSFCLEVITWLSYFRKKRQEKRAGQGGFGI